LLHNHKLVAVAGDDEITAFQQCSLLEGFERKSIQGGITKGIEKLL